MVNRTIHLYSDGRGKRELQQLANRLKEMGRKLEPEVAKEIRGTVVPKLRNDIRQSALTTLPKRGGLAARVAARTTATGGRGVVRIRTRTRYKSDRLMDQGIVRHPVYGNRGVWVSQRITPGWWSKPVEESNDDIMKAANDAVSKIVKSI